jgi:putative endonuclease
MANKTNTTLYLGVTNDLQRRVSEHKAKRNKGFSEKYNCDKLVYFESGEYLVGAIEREKQLKNWKREWKNQLIEKCNPDWEDLSDSIEVTKEMIEIAGQARNDEDGGC